MFDPDLKKGLCAIFSTIGQISGVALAVFGQRDISTRLAGNFLTVFSIYLLAFGSTINPKYGPALIPRAFVNICGFCAGILLFLVRENREVYEVVYIGIILLVLIVVLMNNWLGPKRHLQKTQKQKNDNTETGEPIVYLATDGELEGDFLKPDEKAALDRYREQRRENV